MENERWINNTITIYRAIQKRVIGPSFKISQGGATIRVFDKFVSEFVKAFGSMTVGRLVDFCIFVSYIYADKGQMTLKQIFGPTAISRFQSSRHGTRYYEDRWLEGFCLTRPHLMSLIADRSVHPQTKYIYMQAEEPTKARLLNKPVGYAICQSSTLGWSPLSPTCTECIYIEQCKKDTAVKYPELYRIREEYGNATK